MSHLFATAGADYTPVLSQSLAFDGILTSAEVNLTIVQDGLVEDAETLSAILALEDGTLSSVIILDPMSTDITILDTDSEPVHLV